MVVTGTGHHSSHGHLHKGQQSRLAPAVTSYLNDQGYEFRDVSSKHGGRGGMYEVSLI